MPYDAKLVARIRALLTTEDVVEKKMFGGIAFLVRGHIAVSASGHGGLLVHVPPGEVETLLAKKHVTVMTMGTRTMKGWLRVAPEGLGTKRQLAAWVERGVAHASR